MYHSQNFFRSCTIGDGHQAIPVLKDSVKSPLNRGVTFYGLYKYLKKHIYTRTICTTVSSSLFSERKSVKFIRNDDLKIQIPQLVGFQPDTWGFMIQI